MNADIEVNKQYRGLYQVSFEEVDPQGALLLFSAFFKQEHCLNFNVCGLQFVFSLDDVRCLVL